MSATLLMKALFVMALMLAPAVVVADTVPAPTVQLVWVGKGKAQPLRVAPTKGARQTFVMTSQQSKARGLKGKLAPAEWTPAVRSTIAVEIQDVTPSGDVHIAFSYENVEVLPDKRVKAEVVKAFATGMATFVGIKGTCVITNRGITKQVDFDIPTDASDQVRAAFATVRAVATQLAQPLPEDAVGVGAKWQTTSTTTVGEITANTTTTYQLLSLAGTQAKLKITVNVRGKGSGEGSLTTDTTGSGETTLDLASIMPLRTNIATRTETGLDMDGKRLVQVDTSKVTAFSK